jgi:hypothetical protein
MKKGIDFWISISLSVIVIWSAFIRQEKYWWDESLAQRNDDAVSFLRIISILICLLTSILLVNHRRNAKLSNIISILCLLYSIIRFIGTFG